MKLFPKVAIAFAAAIVLSLSSLPAMAQEGVDVSHYDGAINWTEVKNSGHGDFAYIKALDGEHTKDSYFAQNAQGANAAGMSWAPYQFFRPYSVSSARTQATSFWNSIKGTGYNLTPILDVEVYEKAYTSAQLRADMRAFCDTFKSLSGQKPVIYTYTSFIQDNNLAAYFKDYPLWQAQYGLTRKDTGWDAQVWQYTEDGQVNGITAPQVDLNKTVGSASVPAPSSQTQQTGTVYPYIQTVKQGNADARAVRVSTSWSARVVGEISVGDQYDIMGATTADGWVLIGLNGQSLGYVSASCF